MENRQIIKINTKVWMNEMEVAKDYKFREIAAFDFKEKNIVLLGMRRLGKSEYLKYIFSELKLHMKKDEVMYIDFQDVYFNTFDFRNFENPRLITLLDDIHNYILDNNIKYVFFDEIQKYPRWSSYLTGLINKFKKTKFYATGSDAYSFTITGESGVGRYEVFYVGPLTYKEFSDMKIVGDFNKYFEENVVPDPLLKSISMQYRAIIEKQYTESNIKPFNIELVLRAISLNPGIVFNKANLSKLIKQENGVGPDPDQVGDILTFLRLSNIIIALPDYDTSIRASKTKLYKYYPSNWNLYKLYSVYENYTSIPIDSVPRRGNVFENIIVSNIMSSSHTDFERDKIYTKEGVVPIDLFINGKGYEIKSYDVLSEKDTSKLSKIFNKFEKQKEICNNFSVIHTGKTIISDGVTFINHEEFLKKQLWKK